MQVVRRKCSHFAFTRIARPGGVGALCGNFIQADRSFEHEKHIESIFPNVLHHTGDLLALNDRLMDGLAQLLNQFTQTGCHCYLHEWPAEPECGSQIGISLPYFHSGPRATRGSRPPAVEPSAESRKAP